MNNWTGTMKGMKQMIGIITKIVVNGFWYFSPRRATDAQASLHICADSPEPSIGGPRGERDKGLDPLKSHKNIGFPSNIDSDPLKSTKLPSQHSMVGHYRYASETPFQWHSLAGR